MVCCVVLFCGLLFRVVFCCVGLSCVLSDWVLRRVVVLSVIICCIVLCRGSSKLRCVLRSREPAARFYALDVPKRSGGG